MLLLLNERRNLIFKHLLTKTFIKEVYAPLLRRKHEFEQKTFKTYYSWHGISNGCLGLEETCTEQYIMYNIIVS